MDFYEESRKIVNDQEKTPIENRDRPENQEHLSKLEERRKSQNREPWFVGVILILVGVLFLIQKTTGMNFNNWWALFILIPTVESFTRAWQAIQSADGRVTSSARSSLIGGLVLTTVTAILFFDLDWVIFGPVLLIVAGMGVLLNAVLPK
jgi:uncharacterized membrane protein YjjP (DUF1212 family)